MMIMMISDSPQMA